MDQRDKREITMPLYVVDASVIAKWVLPGEPYQDNAVKLKQDQASGVVELCAPTFLIQEVTNSLWRAVKLNRLSKEDAQEALKALSDMKIDLQELDWSQTGQALEIACKLDLTLYDTCYIFLTKKMTAQLITADNKMYETAKEDYKLLHIKDYL